MSDSKEYDNQLSVDNEQAKQADKSMNMAEDDTLDKQQALKRREEALVQKEQEQKAARSAMAAKETELKDKDAELEEKKKQLEKREEEYREKLILLEKEKGALQQRERALQEAEQEAEIRRNNGYADERRQLDKELFHRRIEQENELLSEKEAALEKIAKEVSKARDSKMAELEKYIAEERKAHEEKRRKLDEREANLKALGEELDYKTACLQSRRDSLKERKTNLDSEVEEKIAEAKKSFESEKAGLKDEIGRLRESIETSSKLLSHFEELKHKLGDEDPAAVLLKLKTYEEQIRNLRDDLATRPTQEMQAAFEQLKNDKEGWEASCKNLVEENKYFKSKAREQSDLEMQIDDLNRDNKRLQRQSEALEAENNRLNEELKRLHFSYEREEEREARIRGIETPYIQSVLPRAADDVRELDWLDKISKSCEAYGLRFPRRILHAFHTALKTSEWSPLTVLAGVSGTGKSELPRLYAHFGGINFLSLSVQPNWDSQESMLGFFNAIDNKFDAQPVLRLLAQSQKQPYKEEGYPGSMTRTYLERSQKQPYKEEGYPGLKDTMSLILMDEMNLAHVELYFAEFLSKLELRRGCKGDDVPCLEVKLGAGMPHYDLPLGRNVLWAGTMNQDETTKSLSDKVLDRGIVIHFPRPTTLERRKQLKPLGDQAPLLKRKIWEGWWCKESPFRDEQILPFKRFIEDVNVSLSKVGRALGHRVWQSIEYYMSNYPDVLEAQRNNDDTGLDRAMKTAFEDQLVQKVMPKLRGIETRGKSKTECLDKIRNQLVNGGYAIVEDFDLAGEFGYGQFIWNSANYLKEDNGINDRESAENQDAGIA